MRVGGFPLNIIVSPFFFSFKCPTALTPLFIHCRELVYISFPPSITCMAALFFFPLSLVGIVLSFCTTSLRSIQLFYT